MNDSTICLSSETLSENINKKLMRYVLLDNLLTSRSCCWKGSLVLVLRQQK